jgi:hypothetical protein
MAISSSGPTLLSRKSRAAVLALTRPRALLKAKSKKRKNFLVAGGAAGAAAFSAAGSALRGSSEGSRRLCLSKSVRATGRPL